MATPLRLLILEDNPSDVALMLNALRHAGYDPIAECAETEQDYRSHLQSAPEIILSDFNMPEFDALRALEIMQASRLDIPIIIVSGSIGEERAEQIMQRGADDYIIKDRMGRLGHVVFQALEQRRLREAKRQAEHALSESERLSRKIEEDKQREQEISREARERTVEINEALVIGSLRQHELTEAADRLNAQLRTEMAERHQAEEALRASDERFRTLFELGPVAVYSCNAAGVIQDFNRRAAELWGRQPALGDTDEQFCGSFKMFRPDGAFMPHHQCPMAEVVAGKMPAAHDAEVLIQRPDGSHITVVANIRPLTNARGEIIGAINCFYDISERKRMEREREVMLKNEQALRIEAQAANSAKDVFLATLSHEMRTPLNAILGWASVIRRTDCTPDEIQEGIIVIERNVHAQAQLINDVLDVSRVASGKLQLEVAPTELVALINDAIDVVRPAARAKAITIRATLDPAASHISCDPHRMRQVILNILTNSTKFTPNDGAITISLSRDDAFTTIQITDNGPGIAPDLLPFIFDRFRQGEGGTKRQYGGLGLGLSLVKNLVELHGGHVSAHSDGPGLGATFTISLPLRAASPNTSPTPILISPTPTPLPLPRLDGLRLVLVDDEPDARDLLVKVLQKAGAAVAAAGSVTDALPLIDTFQPHLLISDIAMPLRDGYELIRLVRRSGRSAKDLPAIALTAFAHQNDIRNALLAGFQMHLSKPVDPYDLLIIIQAMTHPNNTPPKN